MACNNISLAGTDKSCDPSPGGVRYIFIAQRSAITGLTYTYEVTGDTTSIKEQVSGITMSGTSKFYVYQFRPNTANVKSDYVPGDNGAKYYTTVINMIWSKHSTAKRIEFETLGRAEDLVVIYQGTDGICYLCNDINPALMTAGSNETGTARTDLSGYNITLTVDEDFSPLQINMTNVQLNAILSTPVLI